MNYGTLLFLLSDVTINLLFNFVSLLWNLFDTMLSITNFISSEVIQVISVTYELLLFENEYTRSDEPSLVSTILINFV